MAAVWYHIVIEFLGLNPLLKPLSAYTTLDWLAVVVGLHVLAALTVVLVVITDRVFQSWKSPPPWCHRSQFVKLAALLTDWECDHHEAIVQLIATEPSELLTRPDRVSGYQMSTTTLLHLACRRPKTFFAMLERVVQPNEVVLAVQDSQNSTLLHEAASHDAVIIVKYLLDNGADVEAVDTWDYTPTAVALAKEYWASVSMLLAHYRHKRLVLHAPRLFRACHVQYLRSRGQVFHAAIDILWSPCNDCSLEAGGQLSDGHRASPAGQQSACWG